MRKKCKYFICLLLYIYIKLIESQSKVRNFEFSFFNSSNLNQLQIINDVNPSNGILYFASDGPLRRGEIWYNQQVQIRGFTTKFEFRILNATTGEDGFAFLIQNYKLNSEGAFQGGIGYGITPEYPTSGIYNSIAIEFDTFQNNELYDPSNNHISIHTTGLQINNAMENYSIYCKSEGLPDMKKGNHNITIQYTPTTTNGKFDIFMDDLLGPVVAVNTSKIEDLINVTSYGVAWIGITSSSGTTFQTQQILNWYYQFNGNTYPQNSYAYGIGISIAGKESSFIIQGIDQFGNNMTTGGAIFYATLSIEPNISVTIKDNLDGTYTGNYIATKATQSCNLTITMNNQLIQGSPYSLIILPGSFYVQNCIAFESSGQTGLSEGIAGNILQFTIQLKDQFENIITNEPTNPISFNIFLLGPMNSTGSAVYDSKGQYIISYVLTLIGQYQLYILINGINISNSYHLINIFPNQIDGSKCIAPNAGKGGIVGEIISFFLQLRDQYGNDITNPTEIPNIKINLMGKDNITGNSTYISNGQYNISFIIKKSGYYLLSIFVNNQAIIGSPFNISVIPANIVEPSNCFAFGTNMTNSVAGYFRQFYVQLRDKFNNTIENTNNSLEWSIQFDGLSSDSFQYITKKYENGIYLLSYNVTKSGIFDMIIKINNTKILGNPFSCTIIPGPTYAPNCFAYGDGLKETMTGITKNFTIVARDRFNNSRTIGNDHFLVTIKHDSNFFITLNPYDFHNGSYECSYQLSSSGEYILQISFNNISIQGSPFFIHCIWAGLSTPVVIGISVSGGIIILAGLFGIWIYRTKCRRRKEYQRLEETN